ncbi:uncharacterized protein KIAA0930 homolog isoform X1 [Dendrobium catenatum]|uniref:uncharacterized protein KIAA0930 homolog isoform X1 n=1 Tax=Dendrobium catenatum TaxID=906689 RepID=UPI00109F4336|nr:uncharacterized protein KIAA0930 homolog isoform X1 [Dendrobium catenatum]
MDEREIQISSEIRDEEMPSRYEILSMVRKYSKLSETTLEEQDASDAEMDERFWYKLVDMYFVRGTTSEERQMDDLIFFVRNMGLNGYSFKGDLESEAPFFVRRLAPKLEKVLGDDPIHVDWRRSFYLNFVAHTSYTVTVAICSNQALRSYQSGEDTSLSPIYKDLPLALLQVVKTVYASPSRVNFQLGFKKAVETLPAYPNICFAIDDFDDTFDAVVLSESDHCYCVLLNAHGGAAFPDNSSVHETNSYCSPKDCNSDKGMLPKLTLFSGFVSYQMVLEAYEAGRTSFGSILSLGSASSKTDRLYMRGPGGRGEVEVAVSGITDQSQQIFGPHSPLQISKRSFGLGNIVKAASAASVLAKQACTAASTMKKPDKELLPLKCCLMSISLPWEFIAHDLLFKASSPVKL